MTSSLIGSFTTVLSSIVILIVLAKLSRQMDNMSKTLKAMDKKILEEDIIASRISKELEWIKSEFKILEGNIKWKE
mgnify:CR=1 FL=1|jgi:hypothetical protein